MGRPMLARLLAGAMATAAIVTVSGCSGEQPPPPPAPAATPPSSPPPAATFASDEEALAAGVAAVERLNETSWQLVNDPGRDLAALDDLATGTYLETTKSGISKFREDKVTIEGDIKLTGHELVYEKWVDDRVDLQFIVCADYSNFHRKKPDGSEVVTSESKQSQMIVTTEGEGTTSLKVSEVNAWEHNVDCG